MGCVAEICYLGLFLVWLTESGVCCLKDAVLVCFLYCWLLVGLLAVGCVASCGGGGGGGGAQLWVMLPAAGCVASQL